MEIEGIVLSSIVIIMYESIIEIIIQNVAMCDFLSLI